MECTPCGKTFTGEVCYNQHLQSEKHKRKLLAFSYKNGQTGVAENLNGITNLQPQMLKCIVCDMIFNSLERFQSHTFSREHCEKVMHQECINSDVVSSSVSLDPHQVTNDPSTKDKSPDKSDMILPELDNHETPLLFGYARCDVCCKMFSGPEPYKQHMESAIHKKKVELQKNPSFAGLNPNAVYTCETCQKVCSGQIPYMQHMTSDVHKKKLQHLEALKKFASRVDSVTPAMPSLNPVVENICQTEINATWFCKICKIQCSGLIPYQQHLQGASHIKNEKRMSIQNGLFSSSPLVPVAQHYGINDVGVEEKNNNQSVGNPESENILPEFAAKLRIMSTDELSEAVNIFLPDAEIDFDKAMHNDPGSSVVAQNDLKEMNKVIVETTPYQVCEFCDVHLWNKMEAQYHFESKEHFDRRWRSD